MFKPGTLVFLSDGQGHYRVKTLAHDAGDVGLMTDGGRLTKQRIIHSGPIDDGLPGRRLSQMVMGSLSVEMERALRHRDDADYLGPSLIFQLTLPVLSAARSGEQVVAGIDRASGDQRYVRIHPAALATFDWDFVVSEARHFHNGMIYEAVRLFDPTEWKLIAPTGLLRQRAAPTTVGKKATAAEIKAFFNDRLGVADERGERRPTYASCFRECREQLGASEAQMRGAWQVVSERLGIKRGRRSGRSEKTDGKY